MPWWDEDDRALEYTDLGTLISAPPVLDPATSAWVAKVVSLSGVVSGTQQNNVDTLIKGLKSDGNFSLLDRLWLWGGEGQLDSAHAVQATVDIINLVVGTVNGTLTLANGGYTGDGSTGYFDTTTNLSSFGGNYSLNSGAVGVYIRNSRTTGQQYVNVGAITGANDNVQIAPLWNDTFTYYNANDDGNAGSSGTALVVNARGQWVLSRTASNARAVRVNQSALASDSTASSAMTSANCYFFARDAAGTGAAFFSADQLAAGFIGGGLTSAQSDAVASRINAYMTAWGINVY